MRSNRHSLLAKKQRISDCSRLCFSTEFSPLTGKVNNVILKHWRVLQIDPIMRNVCSNPHLIIFKRSSTINDRVVHTLMDKPTKPSWMPTPLPSFYRCGHCVHCANSNDTKYFAHPRSHPPTQEKKNSINIGTIKVHISIITKTVC